MFFFYLPVIECTFVPQHLIILMKKILTIFSVLSILLFAACSGPKEPTFKTMKNLQVKKLSLATLEIHGDAVFNNPNPVGITLSRIDLDISINDVQAAKIKQDISTKVPASSDFTVPIKMSTAPKSVLQDVGGLLQGIGGALKDKKIKVNYKGNVYFSVAKVEIPVPVEYTEEIPVKNLKLF